MDREQGNMIGERGSLKRASALLLDWLLPAVCVCCEDRIPTPRRDGTRVPAGWCEACAQTLPGRRARRCPVCGESGQPGGAHARPCPRCDSDPPAFDQSIVLADYAPPLDHLVQAIKFGRQSALAKPLGRLLATVAAAHFTEVPALRPDLVVAVPLTPARLAERGFNQALLLAQPVAHALGLQPSCGVLERVRQGAPASSLGAQERREALEDAFLARPLAGAPAVLVIDDVMTTGATLQAVALALRAAGAGFVVNCVAARTPLS
jgi:ComF family protein